MDDGRFRSGGPDRPFTVIYDGACGVCARSMRLLDRWDGTDRFEIAPYQDHGVRQRFPGIPTSDFESSWQVVGPDGGRWQGAAAVERVLALLPRGGWFSWIFRIPLVRPAAERLYRWFARNRRRFGCGEHCSLEAPSGEGG